MPDGGDDPFLSIPPFVVTLAGMFLARGARLLISTQSVPISHPFIDAIQGFYIAFQAAAG